MQILMTVRRWITAPASLLIGGGGEDAEFVAEVETPGNLIRVHEVRRRKDGIRELKRRLEDSRIENSNLARELQGSQHENSTLDNHHREALGQLEKVQAMEKTHRVKLEEAVEYCNNLHAKHENLVTKYREVAATNRNQKQELTFMKETNTKIRTELETRSAQLNKFTAEIARQSQRVNTSAIRDDEYFARKFADLAKDIRNWSFTYFFPRSQTFDPTAVTNDLQDAISAITGGVSLREVFKNRATGRRVVAGLLADQLKKRVLDPLLLDLLHEEFLGFENTVAKTGTEKSAWLSQTLSLFVKSEHFEEKLSKKVGILSRELNEKLGVLAQESSESKASKRCQKLLAIVQRAANLAVEISQQPYWFLFFAPLPGSKFNPRLMEDVETELFLEEANPGAREADRTVSIPVFPSVARQEHVEGGHKPTHIVINKAWVTLETVDSHTAVEQKDADMASEQAKVDVESGGRSPSGCDGGRGELGAQGGDGSEVLQHSDMPATEVAPPVLPPQKSPAVASQQEYLAVDVDLARKKMEMVSLT
ncbi:unnamed protein product [Tuber aestivum]|uniref:Uncharacterized protein n=1 Tax=Tuber aestivum TaxID=59557 RepID=A0A292PZH9_9PEZI|nr:unnamed protein product [Tuber aestivum]